MKIAIVGGGNMGGAIAQGLGNCNEYSSQNITVINKSSNRDYGNGVKSVVGDYSALLSADIVVFAVKPWMIADVVNEHFDKLLNTSQLILSVAASVSLKDLSILLPANKPIFRVMPNTAISQRQSMTFISSMNTNKEQDQFVLDIFQKLGKAELIEEKLFSAATSISGCGIAYAFRYIRASMEGGIEMGLNSELARNSILQTLRGAIELLEANNTHPEVEIDRVTTPGGLTIKGLNELEHSGFTSAVIKGLKASNIG